MACALVSCPRNNMSFAEGTLSRGREARRRCSGIVDDARCCRIVDEERQRDRPNFPPPCGLRRNGSASLLLLLADALHRLVVEPMIGLIVPPDIDQSGANMRIGPHTHAGQFVDPAPLDLRRGFDDNLVKKRFEQEVFVVPAASRQPPLLSRSSPPSDPFRRESASRSRTRR